MPLIIVLLAINLIYLPIWVISGTLLIASHVIIRIHHIALIHLVRVHLICVRLGCILWIIIILVCILIIGITFARLIMLRHSLFALDPFPIYIVAFIILYHSFNTFFICESDEPKPSRSTCFSVKHYNTIFYLSKLFEKTIKYLLGYVWRQTTDENLFRAKRGGSGNTGILVSWDSELAVNFFASDFLIFCKDSVSRFVVLHSDKSKTS
mmetsp:Transcript_7105/g.6957  ORF Transcript_7105/g.6957 Transcript_7105/m.6957 type:complete len:209 (-) Transcript_7105:152-778(-)